MEPKIITVAFAIIFVGGAIGFYFNHPFKGGISAIVILFAAFMILMFVRFSQVFFGYEWLGPATIPVSISMISICFIAMFTTIGQLFERPFLAGMLFAFGFFATFIIFFILTIGFILVI